MMSTLRILKRLNKKKEGKLKPWNPSHGSSVSSIDHYFLKGLAGPGMIPPTQDPANATVANNMPKMVEEGGNDTFFRPLLGFVTKCNEDNMLT